MRSIRQALRRRILIGALVLAGVTTAIAYRGASSLLTGQFDLGLRAKLDSLTARIEQEGHRIEADFAGRVRLPEFQPGPRAEVFQVWLAESGATLARSASLGSATLTPPATEPGIPTYRDVELPDGRRGRAAAVRFRVRDYEATYDDDPGPAELVLVVARERASLDRSLSALLTGAGLCVLVVALGGGWLVTRTVDAGLRPVARLVRHAEVIRDPTNAAPFDAASSPTELRAIAHALNALVERTGQTLERERRTSTAIAHELRTPVAEIRTIADVALQEGAEPGEQTAALESIRSIARHMGASIATLLQLSHLESGRTTLAPERVALDQLLRSAWHAVEPNAARRGLELELDAAPGSVETDPVVLAMLLGNLLDNAVAYAVEETSIRASLSLDERGAARIRLTNRCADLDPQDVERIDEPFWRRSAAREDRDHIGLGLSLARRYAEVLDAELAFSVGGGEFTCTLTLSASGSGSEIEPGRSGA